MATGDVAVRGRRRRHRDEEDLACLRQVWTSAYAFPRPLWRWWQRRPVLTARNRTESTVVTGRSAAELEQAILEDYRAMLVLAAPQPVPASRLQPDDDCVSPAMMTCLDLLPNWGRPYVHTRDLR